jgi:hypothetical protein
MYFIQTDFFDGFDKLEDLLLTHGHDQMTTVEKKFIQNGCNGFLLFELIQKGYFAFDLSALILSLLRSGEPGIKTCGFNLKSFSVPFLLSEYLTEISFISFSIYVICDCTREGLLSKYFTR